MSSTGPAVLEKLTAPSSTPERTLLVGPTRGTGRELLRALALHGPVGWVGFEATTPAALAHDLVSLDLAREGLNVADEFDRRAIVDEAIDAALADAPDALRDLGEGVGFRDALANAVEALRLAGLTPDDVERGDLEDAPKRRALAATLRRHADGLKAARLVDAADVIARATAAVAAGKAPRARVLLLPDLRRRGLAGRFLAALEAAGAEALPEEPSGESAAHLFAAASPTDELREVLRRVLASGRPWDEVEVVATDATLYGCALDALATRLGIPVSYAVGLPIERTRQGRAALAYLTWIQEDFPADVPRRLLETGDLRPEGEGAPSSERLARRLRALRVGWGRDRYLLAIDRRLKWLDEAPVDAPDEWRSAEEIADSRARERDELVHLRALIAPILDAAPPVPDRVGRGPGRLSPAAIARGLEAFLRRVPAPSPVEIEARERLLGRLGRIAERLDRPAPLGSAIAVLRAHLQIRVPSPGTEGPLPWSSAGGALHFSDVDHGGWTGRPLTFVVGLDAERFPGAGLQDPILLDDDRRRLDPAALPSSTDRLDEARATLNALLARLRGDVTLSYAAWSSTEGRAVAPAADLLEALRRREGNPALDYDDFHAAVAPIAGPIPRGAGRLDAADVWLGSLESGGILASGVEAVREANPRLDRGLAAREALEGDVATAWHGVVAPRPEVFDPRVSERRILSSSTLEVLGACPLHYFYAKVLRIEPPDDPELDPAAWLEPRHRGSLLHDVYENALQRARERDVGFDDAAFEALAREVLAESVEWYRVKVPAPSEVVFRAEVVALEADVRSFVAMVREHPPQWLQVEHVFGYGRGAPPPVEIALEGGTIRVCGRIDRIDETENGRLAVVDYKTGSTYGYSAKEGTWSKGRHLQHLVYTRVVQQLFGRDVDRMEYWFPSVKAGNERAVYETTRLAEGERVLETLCETIGRGWFVPTDDESDCRYCDYKEICRVRQGAFFWDLESPRAAWSKAHGEGLEAFAPLRALRGLP